MGTIRGLMILLLGLISCATNAEIHYNINNPDIMLQINQQPLSSNSIKILQQTLETRSPLPLKPLLEEIIINRVMSATLLKQLDELILPRLKQGVDSEVFALLNQYFKHKITMMPAKYIIPIPKPIKTKAVFKQNRSHLKLNPEQIKIAKTIRLARYQLPNQPHPSDVNLWDIYPLQSISGKQAIFNQNQAFIQQVTTQHLLKIYIYYLAEQANINIAELSLLIKDKRIKQAYLHQIGAFQVLHEENEQVYKRAKSITDKAIQTYYKQHQQDYVQVTQVAAQHIHLDNQALADKVYAELQQGMDFATAVKTYSTTNDKQLTPPGDLNIIKVDDKDLTLVKKIALLQPVNKISRPFRTPNGWEIYLLRQRQQAPLPITDEGLRHDISKILARAEIRQEFNQLSKKLLKTATINVNYDLIAQKLYEE